MSKRDAVEIKKANGQKYSGVLCGVIDQLHDGMQGRCKSADFRWNP